MRMSSQTLSLPVIDFSIPNLKPETPEWDSVRGRVRKALEDYGSFEALFDGASVELRKTLLEASKEVFDLPMETKLNASNSESSLRGYRTPSPSLPEFIGIGGVDNPEVVHELTHKLWPQGNITFSKNISSIGKKIIELNLKVCRMIMESFGLEKYVEEHLNSGNNHFYLNKYKGLEDNNNQEKIGLGSHVDRHLLTILFQNDVVDGVEIITKNGQDWIKANPSQDSSFLVIAGVSLHVLLNGRVFPPAHRVVITGKKDRYSAGLFFRPKQGLINAPEEVVDDEHPRLYKPFDFEAYVKVTDLDTKQTDRLSVLKTLYAL